MNPTLEQFRQMDAETQRATLAEMNRQVQAKLSTVVDEAFYHHELESSLVPQIQFKKAEPARVEISPPSGDPDQGAREFFQRFPDTKSIRIGNTLYERS